MAEALVEAKLTMDSSPYERSAKRAADATSKIEDAEKSLEKASKLRMASQLASNAALLTVGAGMAAMLKQGVRLAAAQAESADKMSKVFGAASKDVEKYASSVETMSKRAIYDATSSMGQLGQAAGLTGKALADFSTGMVTLSQDLAAFKGGTPERALLAVEQALRGQYAAIGQYGVLLNDATLRQQAFKMGLIQTTTQALTPQQKVLAAQSAIMEQTTDAQGALADSAGTLTYAQQAMAAQAENAKASLGQALLPALIAVTEAATSALEVFNNLPEGVRKLAGYAAVALAGMSVLGPVLQIVTPMVQAYRTAQLEAAVASQVMGASAATASKGGLLSLVGVLGRIAGLASLFVALSWGANKLLEKFNEMGRPIEEIALMLEGASAPFRWLRDIFADTGDAAADAAGPLTDYSSILDQIGPSADLVAEAAREMGSAIGSTVGPIEAAADSMRGLINAQLAIQAGRDGLRSMTDDFRASILGPGTTVSGGGSARAAASKAETAALQKTIDKIREKDRAEMDAEIAAARRRAKNRAEARADAQARKQVQEGIAKAISTDKAARAGRDIDGFNQTGSLGEATGSLTKGEQAALDKKIEAIRTRHRKAVDAQVKGLRDAAAAQREANGATRESTIVYKDASNSLDKNTDAGLRNRETLRGKVEEILAIAEAEKQAALAGGAKAEEAERVWAESLKVLRDGLIDSAVEAGFTRDAVMGYLKEIELADKDFKIIFKLIIDKKSEDEVKRKLATWGSKIAVMQKAEAKAEKLALELGREPAKPSKPVQGPVYDPKRPRSYPATPRFTFYADGGEVYGPGGPRADRVPVWASAGEYIVNARQYAANRELVRAINAGSGKVAAGGMTIGQVNVTEASPSGVRVSVIDALAEAAYRGGRIR